VAQAHDERTETITPFNLASADFAVTAMRRFEEFAKTQTEQFEKFRETNRQWLDRMQAEANLASEFASKLTAARSIPDAMTAYQEWASRRFEMVTEDTKHIFDDVQKFMHTSAQLLANGRQSKGPSTSI
jgi:hypothetical protein